MSTNLSTSTSRPRVEGEREAEIFDAVQRLLAEVGYDKLTFDAVAAAVHAGKATLYRRWPTKAALVMDAVARCEGCDRTEPADTGSLRGDLIAEACAPGGLADEIPVSVIGAVVPALHRDPELFAAFHERFIGPKLALSVRLFERAKEQREVSADADTLELARLLPAICTHATFVFGEAMTRERITRIVDAVVLPACRATFDPPPDDPRS